MLLHTCTDDTPSTAELRGSAPSLCTYRLSTSVHSSKNIVKGQLSGKFVQFFNIPMISS